MKYINDKGYLLIEVILAVCIGMLVLGTASMLLFSGLKDWSDSESRFEITYNLREAMNYIADEIRGSYSVEILDFSDDGWIKVYKTSEKSKFTTFRLKNNKLFIGFGNTLNPNAEISNFIKAFKVTYIPEGETDPDKATGVKLLLKFERNKQQLETITSLAYRCRN